MHSRAPVDIVIRGMLLRSPCNFEIKFWKISHKQKSAIIQPYIELETGDSPPRNAIAEAFDTRNLIKPSLDVPLTKQFGGGDNDDVAGGERGEHG